MPDYHFLNGNISLLPVYIVLLPLFGAALAALLRRHEAWRNLAAVLTSGGVFLLCTLLFLTVLSGTVTLAWPEFLGLGLFFQVDLFSALFALFTSLIWFLATLFSWTYMAHEHRRTRYYVFLLITLTGCIGVFLAGDLISLFVFFEIMSLISYVLVIHTETEEAMAAGRSYLYLSIIGGLSLLAGIILLHFATGTTALAPQQELLEQSGSVRYLILLSLIVGFGIKAGMVPLHVWLPKAHPVAPSPASALLSGIMIKTGAYGIIRVVNLVIAPAAGEHGHWLLANTMGYIIIWIAIATMFSAALMALFQTNIKRILAYSSISQMGYILMGVGCAAYLGYDGGLAFGSFSYHILNHAFFKAGMFMMAGAIYARTHELELSRLGGLARSFPFTTGAFLVAALGISGFPGFNGYISKTLLHHAIVEAYEHHHLLSLNLAEKLFMFTSILTVCYIFKLFTGVFFGARPEHLQKLPREPFLERIVFTVFAAVIIFLGNAPMLILERAIVPAAGSFIYGSLSVGYLLKQQFLNPKDLAGVLIPIFCGLALLYLMKRLHLFSRTRFPFWLSVDRHVYAPASRYSLALFTAAGNVLEKNLDRSYVSLPGLLAPVYRGLIAFDERILPDWGRSIKHSLAGVQDKVYTLWLSSIEAIFGTIFRFLRGGFRTLFQMDNRPKSSKAFQVFGSSNLDFNLLIIIFTLIIILGFALFLK